MIRRQGDYEIDRLRSIRPVSVEPEDKQVFLPDNPTAFWGDYTYTEHPDLRTEMETIQERLESFANAVFALLAKALKNTS